MADNSNSQSMDQGRSVISAVEQMVDAVFRAASSIKNLGRFKGPIWLVVIVVAAFAAGRGSGYLVTLSPSPPDPSLAEAVPMAATTQDVGLLDGVTITNTWIKQLPGHSTQSYIIGIQFPNPHTCDSSCNTALIDILGPDTSCEGQECSAELEDVDEGSKTNSADLYERCNLYQAEGQKVQIMFSGLRDQNISDFANILLVTPSAR
jgi:hypothetical protein